MWIFCLFYYICSYTYSIPQLIKLIRRKKSNDYSLIQLLISFIGLSCWTTYIYTSYQSIIVYVGTAIDMVLLSLVDFFIIYYYKRNIKLEKLKFKNPETDDLNTINKMIKSQESDYASKNCFVCKYKKKVIGIIISQKQKNKKIKGLTEYHLIEHFVINRRVQDNGISLNLVKTLLENIDDKLPVVCVLDKKLTPFENSFEKNGFVVLDDKSDLKILIKKNEN